MNAPELRSSGDRNPIHNRVPLLDLTALPHLNQDQQRLLQTALELRGEQGIDPTALMHTYVGPKYIQEGSGKSRIKAATSGLNRVLLTQEYPHLPGRYIQIEDVGDREHPALDFVHVSKAELEARAAKAAGKTAPPPIPLTPPLEYFDPFDHPTAREYPVIKRTDLLTPHPEVNNILPVTDYLKREVQAVRAAASPAELFTITVQTPQDLKAGEAIALTHKPRTEIQGDLPSVGRRATPTGLDRKTSRTADGEKPQNPNDALKEEILRRYKELIPDDINYRLFSLLVDGTAQNTQLSPDTIYRTFYSGAHDRDIQLDVTARLRQISLVLSSVNLDIAYRSPRKAGESDGYVIVRNQLKPTPKRAHHV